VDVEKIEGVELGDFGHASGEGEVVGWVLKKRVVRDRDFVVTDIGFSAGEAEGLRVGDEMDVVAASGELDAEFGGDDSGAAVGGIAGDADFHEKPGLKDIFVAGVGLVLVEGPEGAYGTKVPIVDEVWRIKMRGIQGEGLKEGEAFDFAGHSEAGADGVEVAVVVARMADKFPEAVGHGGEDLVEDGGVELAGGRDADGAVGGQDFVVADLGEGSEAGFEEGHEGDLEASHEVAVAEFEGPRFFEGVADGAYAGALADVEKGTRDGGEDVGVLMRVDVGDVDAGALEVLDLGEGFDGYLVFGDFAAEDGEEEVWEGGAEGLGVGTEEGGDAMGVGERGAVG
jgi:hypothetical protein